MTILLLATEEQLEKLMGDKNWVTIKPNTKEKILRRWRKLHLRAVSKVVREEIDKKIYEQLEKMAWK